MEHPEEYWPTRAWRTADPQTFQMKIEDFQPLQRLAEEDDRVHSLLIARSGYIIFEEYYHGWSQNHYHNVNSVTKSVTSALTGIALREKLIETTHQSIFAFFPEYAELGEQENRKAIQLHHLLSLTSGFKLMGDIDIFLEQTDSVERILSRPVVHPPGQVFSYDDIDIHLASLILARATGMPVVDFARRNLFQPLGIWRDEQGQVYPWKHGTALADAPHPLGLWNEQEDWLWSIDRQGNTIGSFGLQLTTREMAKLGLLYLRQGRWDGQQLIPVKYVQASLQIYNWTDWGAGYGYCWYRPQWQRPNTFWALGFGGQLLVCFPDLDMIFAMTARPEVGREASHIKMLHDGLDPLLQRL